MRLVRLLQFLALVTHICAVFLGTLLALLQAKTGALLNVAPPMQQIGTVEKAAAHSDHTVYEYRWLPASRCASCIVFKQLCAHACAILHTSKLPAGSRGGTSIPLVHAPFELQ